MDALGAPDEARARRTVKSCGPDISTLMSSERQCLRIALVTVTKSPITGESMKEAVKTIRAGNAGMFRRTCGGLTCVLFYYAREAAGASRIRHFLRPLFSGGMLFCKDSEAKVSREGKAVSEIEMYTQARLSCPDLIRASINLHESVFAKRWMAGSSPAMTAESASQKEAT